jgi:N-acetyl-anhydromuramyl-L-alanine amidase AmpD
MCATAIERHQVVMPRRLPVALLCLPVAAMAACGRPPSQPQPCPAPAAARVGASRPPVDSVPSPFDPAFAAAAHEFAVPVALLKAIGWVETRWQMVEGQEEFPGRPAAFGVMALRGAALERGAALAGVTVNAARHDPLANIRAAAALLDAYAAEAGLDRSGASAWTPVAIRFSGIEIPEGRAAYTRALDQVLSPQQRLAGPAVAADTAPCPPPAATDYANAVWRSSPNFNDRPADSTGQVHLVIIHTCESGYTSCWSWLVNPASQVSAHYVVDEDGTEVTQLVRERNRAWHIAAVYDCTLNHDHDCWLDGVQSNHFTVGVEHAGFASQDSFPSVQVDASAALVCDLTRRLDVPRDWQHIVGHGQLQPANRVDPGPRWPWIPYLHRVQADCGEVVVDDSDEFNDDTVASAEAPPAWAVTSATPDYYGGGYRWAPTAAGATDAAVFSFRLAAAGRRVVDARWTGGSNRSPHAVYVVIDAGGDTLAAVSLDQRTGGGAWHALGVWDFPAGWSRVALLRRDPSGAVVVADAVRVRIP